MAAPLAGLALRCQPDSRLVRLSREGQARAFEEIVRRYRGPLVSFAGAIVPADRAEDVVQEALAKSHAALLTSDADVKLKPWLYMIVRNRALNDLRDEPPHERLDEDFDGIPQPPEVAARRAEITALVAGLKGLPPNQRDALVQRELEGRSHSEIGAALGVSPGAVRGLIFRARTALRDAAGVLTPMPVLRVLLNAGPLEAEAAGTAIGGAAAGLAAGGGGGVAAKAGTTLAVAVLAVGSGVAIQNRGGGGADRGAAFASKGDDGTSRGEGGQEGGGGSGSPGESGHGSGPGSDSGPRGEDNSGHGSGDSDDTADSSSPGDGDDHSDEDERSESDRSNEHEGSDSGSSGSESSGPGGGGSESSGPGGGGSESSGPGGGGSESSGPGGGGSGSSGSGSSGPG